MIYQTRKYTFVENIRNNKYLYLMLLPALILVFIFCYVPIYGIVVAFQDYKLLKGIRGSEWVGLINFTSLFSKASFMTALKNTVVISGLRLLIGFPAPILFALFINEIVKMRFKKIVQTFSYLPYFISWVVISGMIIEVLSPERGIVNAIIKLVGGQRINFLAEPGWFLGVLIFSGIWQSVGWGSVIYLSAIAGISSELYESASIDGATRVQKAKYITIPGMYPMIIISLMLSISGILNAGFDQIFNLYSPLVYGVSDIIDTYLYRLAFSSLGSSSYSGAAAVGLFKNIVGFLLLYFSNQVTKKVSDYTFW